MNPLPDLTAPPEDLVQDLRNACLIESNARFQNLYGGRTNQVWKVLGGDGDKVLKLYRANLRNPLFRNDAELEAQCLRALQDTGFVPRLRATGTHENGHWVFYDHAPGSPWQSQPQNVADLLYRLHTHNASVLAPAGCNGSSALDAHTAQILDGCVSKTKAQLEQLRPNLQVAPNARSCLIHGDPVAGNILVAPSGLTLIDWQCPAYGDPCEDIAMFLSPAMQYLYRGQPLSSEEEHQFLTAYGDVETVERFKTLRPWYAWRMAAYCLWRVENGAEDYAVGLRLEASLL